jgi:flavonol 3-O-methyltransferase/caffeic acid 3-O-methyltransferase
VDPVVVDVGGGVGHQLSTILARHPRWKGIVFDLPKVLEDREADDSRMSFMAGSFFDAIPKGDVLLLKWILHDWDDVHCRQILAKLRDAMLFESFWVLQLCHDDLPMDLPSGKHTKSY